MEYRKLKELATISISNVDKKTAENEKTVRLCNFVDVYRNWAITENMIPNFMIASAKENEIEKYALHKGDVCITKDSETKDDIGMSTYIADDIDGLVLGYHCALISPDKSVLDGKYLNAFLQTDFVRKFYELNASGSGQRYTLSLDAIGEIPIPIISLEEQKRKGELLSLIDRKIENNNKINDNLLKMVRSIYNYWFIQFDFPNDSHMPYKTSGGALSWNAQIKRSIPDHWSVTEFQNVCTIRRGASPRPIDSFMDETHKGMPWVKISDATSSISPFMVKIKEHIIPEGISKSVHVEPGTLIVSNSATPGIPKYIQIDACVHDGWLVLDDYAPELRYYLYFVIEMVRDSLVNIATGSIFKNLNTDYLKEYKCVIPPSHVMAEFDKIISPIMSKLLETEKENLNLKSLRDYILPFLMNGQATIAD